MEVSGQVPSSRFLLPVNQRAQCVYIMHASAEILKNNSSLFTII